MVLYPALATAEMPGFSIRGGILNDSPSTEIFKEIDSGIGYIGSLGFDVHARFGFEIGVMHSTHDYTYDVVAGAVREEQAEKNTFFIKARGIPLKMGKTDLLLAAGPAFFDISGLGRFQDNQSGNYYDLEEGFSGWGAVFGLDLRYHVSKGLALTFYMSSNLVRYNRYSINSADAVYPRRFPRGDSFSWGLTVFHRIGVPKL